MFFLRLGHHTGDGHLWSVYEADLVVVNVPALAPCAAELRSRISHRVVVKVTRAGQTTDNYIWCEHFARTEAELYAGPLMDAGLMGTVVPTFYGMWRSSIQSLCDELIVAVFEHVGEPLADNWSLMHPYWT